MTDTAERDRAVHDLYEVIKGIDWRPTWHSDLWLAQMLADMGVRKVAMTIWEHGE